jgi:hypothetical protein
MKLFSSTLFKTPVRLTLIVGVLSVLVRFNGASIYVSNVIGTVFATVMQEYRGAISSLKRGFDIKLYRMRI